MPLDPVSSASALDVDRVTTPRSTAHTWPVHTASESAPTSDNAPSLNAEDLSSVAEAQVKVKDMMGSTDATKELKRRELLRTTISGPEQDDPTGKRTMLAPDTVHNVDTYA